MINHRLHKSDYWVGRLSGSADPQATMRAALLEAYRQACTDAEQELERIFDEGDTLNLLHGAARVAALRDSKKLEDM